MKKVLTFIVLISLPLLSAGQNNTSVDNTTKEDTTIIETTIQKNDIKEQTALKAETKAQVLDLNYKKSIDLISIKAYRKSLQIKVKTIKMC